MKSQTHNLQAFAWLIECSLASRKSSPKRELDRQQNIFSAVLATSWRDIAEVRPLSNNISLSWRHLGRVDSILENAAVEGIEAAVSRYINKVRYGVGT